MHILILPSEEFLPAGSTTVGIFQYHQAKVLQRAGHRVGILSVSQSFSPGMLAKGFAYKMLGRKAGNACDDYSLPALARLAYRKAFRPNTFVNQETVRGLNVFRVNGFYHRPPKDYLNHAGWVNAGLAAYEQYTRRHGKPDVLHAHNAVYAGMLAAAIHRRHGPPFVLTEHSTAFARKAIQDKGVLRRIRAAYESAAVLSAVSRPFCELLNAEFGIRRFQPLHNVLDPDFENNTQVTAARSDGFTFVNIAELHPKKDHIGLITAFKQVWQRRPMIRLLIGGDGDLATDLRLLVEREGLQDAVTFLGLLKRPQVFAALAEAHCLVLNSKYETFGVVVIEALLLGKPVIVTRCGGPESFVTPETGLVIDKEDTEALAAAMIRLMETHDRYDADRIRGLALQSFGAAAFLRNVEALYRQATGCTAAESEKERVPAV